MAQQSYLDANNEARQRLKALSARLTDDDMRRSIGHGWTVSATLAHLAYWDRWNLARLENWERQGVHIVPTDPDPINNSMLPQWLAMSPSEVRREALAAAEAVDRKVETLPQRLVEDILAQRPRSLVRATHRREHVEEIERALADSPQP